MRAVVTGAAGFIGSHLAEALVARGDEVTAVDSFTPHYPRALKDANAAALRSAGVTVVEADLRDSELGPLLDGAAVVYHLAAQPGVRSSWADFDLYLGHNVAATQRLLQWAREHRGARLVVASSSSVYGNAARYPVREDDELRPFSPYGVTKRAVEDLCRAYADNWDVHSVVLRYFTVYGPRQRPDMAIQRMVDAALAGEAFPLYGDGAARREFTFVDDVVAATLAAADAEVAPATPLNVAGGSEATVADLLELVGEAVGAPVDVDRRPASPGDVARTGAVIDRTVEVLGWSPEVPLAEGVKRQVAWARTAPGT